MTLRVVALGDSLSCGEGVGLRVPRPLTWPALLTAGLPGAELLCAARPGARVRDVRAGQLASSVAAGPHLATVLAGLNDVARGGFSGPRFAGDLAAVVHELRRSGATVLLGRLHDPCRLLPLVPPLRAAVRRRVGVVNAAVDGLAGAPGVHVLDLDAVPGLRLRRTWDVDRIHPAATLHSRIARAAAEVLRAAGLPLELPPVAALPGTDPGVLRELHWAGRHGVPWLAANLAGVATAARELARG